MPTNLQSTVEVAAFRPTADAKSFISFKKGKVWSNKQRPFITFHQYTKRCSQASQTKLTGHIEMRKSRRHLLLLLGLAGVFVVVLHLSQHGSAQLMSVVTTDHPEQDSHHYHQAVRSSQTHTTAPVPSCGGGVMYVTALRYKGQQGAGVRSIASFQCFLQSLKHPTVFPEPNIQNNFLWGHPVKGGMKIGDLFDIETFNNRSREVGRPGIITMDEFVQCCPKHAILINIVLQETKRVTLWPTGSETINGSCLTLDSVSELLHKEPDLAKKLNESLLRAGPDSCVVRVIELPVGRNSILSQGVSGYGDISNFLFGGWSPWDVLLDFSHWAGPFNVPVDTNHNGTKCLQEYKSSKMVAHLFTLSKRLMQDAKRYEDMFLGGENRLAIMLRAEKIALGYSYMKSGKYEALMKCFRETWALSRQIVGNGTKFERPMVTLDIGKFGSSTLYKMKDSEMVTSTSKRALATFFHKWTFQKWEESFIKAAGGRTTKAYIAALQRVLASRADCLVLMGGGDFQALALEGYLANHKRAAERCVHLVCCATQETKLLPRLLAKAAITNTLP